MEKFSIRKIMRIEIDSTHDEMHEKMCVNVLSESGDWKFTMNTNYSTSHTRNEMLLLTMFAKSLEKIKRFSIRDFMRTEIDPTHDEMLEKMLVNVLGVDQ